MVVRAAGYYKAGGTCGGATNPVHIQSEPNPQGGIQVGFFEASAGAIGQMSKASGWLAALVSTDLLGEDLTKHRISFSRTDRVDGPSAGGLMTSGLVALLRGEAFPADVSMTGTINPDGTIGPVGGIAHKIMGAADSGIKRFAIPLGQRHDYNLCTEEVEDVVEIGRALGIEVAEVGDIREAYAFLTGNDLPSAPGRQISEQLPEEVRAGFRALYQIWLKRYLAAQSIVAGASRRDFPKELQSIWRHGELFLESAEREFNTGHEPAAFNRIWMAVLHAEYTARGVGAMQALFAGGFPGLQAVVGNDMQLVRREVDSGLAQLKDIHITTVADAGAVATIGSLVAVTLTYLDQAAAELALSKKLSLDHAALDPEEIVTLAFEAISHITFAQLLMDAALLNKNWIGQGTKLWQKAADPVVTARSLFTSAALSNLRYVDVLYTEREADKRQQDLQTATDWVKRKDLSYLAAVGALEKQYGFFDLFTDEYTAVVAQLGALMSTLANASLLVAQHYSIGVETDKLGRVIGFYSEDALKHMLALAEATAIRAVGEADAATDGDSTPMLVVALDAARRNRDAAITAQDTLTALSLFWTTTLNARMMTRLARGI
ncbi:MAG: S16 family serine protease [Pseudomonadota bacterium]